MVVDAHKRRRVEDEDEEDEGGINIASAAKRLRKEDKEVDRLLERERVKLKHRVLTNFLFLFYYLRERIENIGYVATLKFFKKLFCIWTIYLLNNVE
jgi:hypothetical protein